MKTKRYSALTKKGDVPNTSTDLWLSCSQPCSGGRWRLDVETRFSATNVAPSTQTSSSCPRLVQLNYWYC